MCYELLAIHTCGLKHVHLYVTLNVVRDTSGECWEHRLLLGTTSPENEPFIAGLLHCRIQQARLMFPNHVGFSGTLLEVLSEIAG
jgi:hypothetical protein